MGKSRFTKPPSPSADGDGGAWRPSLGYVYIAVGLVVVGLAMAWMGPTEDANEPVRVANVTPTLASAPSEKGVAIWSIQANVPVPDQRPMAPDTRPTFEGDHDPTADLSSYVARGAQPTMHEVIDRLRAAGVETGLAAFNPPGTRPNKVGLAVPEDFVLPEGYVRHHQATDDGQRVEAILMFAPDRPLLDVNRQPVAIPKDRVVPPELAPPGLPLRQIVIPPPHNPGSVGL